MITEEDILKSLEYDLAYENLTDVKLLLTKYWYTRIKLKEDSNEHSN